MWIIENRFRGCNLTHEMLIWVGWNGRYPCQLWVVKLHEISFVCHFINQRSPCCFESGKNMEKALFFLLVQKTAALGMKITAIWQAVGIFHMSNVAPFGYVAAPLVGGAHGLYAAWDVLSYILWVSGSGNDPVVISCLVGLPLPGWQVCNDEIPVEPQIVHGVFHHSEKHSGQERWTWLCWKSILYGSDSSSLHKHNLISVIKYCSFSLVTTL